MPLHEFPQVFIGRLDAEDIKRWLKQCEEVKVSKKAIGLKLLEEVFELAYASGATPEEVRIVWENAERKADKQKLSGGMYFTEEVEKELGDVVVSLGCFCYFANLWPAASVNGVVEKIKEHVWYPDEFGVLRRAKDRIP